MGKQAILVYDITGKHTRLKYFAEMVDDVFKKSNGELKITPNPGGKALYLGKASLEAVRDKKAPLALLNSSHLQSVDSRLGFLNMPFSINDENMLKPGAIEKVIELAQTYLKSSGLTILGLMRGADSIFVFKNHQVRSPEDIKDLRLRIPGEGIYREIVDALGATAVILPTPQSRTVIRDSLADGLFTSPSGWLLADPPLLSGTLVPGIMFYTYSFIVDKAWLDSLSDTQRQALIDAARKNVTDKWRDMKNDDQQLISRLTGQGASYFVIPPHELEVWQKCMETVNRRFADAHPEVIKKFQAIMA